MNVLFIDGTGGFHPHRLKEKPSGGIITSLTHIPRYLAAKGIDTNVLCAYDKDEKVDGVQYITKDTIRFDYDVVVFNRNAINRTLVEKFSASRRIWWLHDIVDPGYLQDDAFKFVDGVVALSEYCKDCYSDFYSMPAEKFIIIPNGVDKSVFFPGTEERDPSLFVYASAPIKGSYPLGYALYNLQRVDPKVRLLVYANQSLHDLKNEPHMDEQLRRLQLAGATLMDPISQEDLAQVFRRAWALLMPNHYPEICSNLLLQAQACGLPVIASGIGSAGEFIEDGVSGLLTKSKPHDMFMWWKHFAELCMKLRQSPELHKTISDNSPKKVKSWDEIGEAWYQMLTHGGVPSGLTHTTSITRTTTLAAAGS